MDTNRVLNTNYTIKLTVRSPLHIGAGAEKNWVRGFDFIESKGKVWIIDKDKLFQQFEDEKLLNQYLNKTKNARWHDVEKFLTENFELEDISLHSFKHSGGALTNDIRTLARDGEGRAYIPGSSLKGAITSAIFHYIWDSTNPKGYNKFINNDLLGSFGESIMRYIRPADVAMPPNTTEINNVALFNLYRDGSTWESDFKDGFKVSVEHFKVNTTHQFRLSIANGLGEIIREAGAKINMPMLPKYYNQVIASEPAEHLFKIINRCSAAHLDREIDFFQTYDQADDTDMIVNQLKDLKKISESSPKTCILRMAGHSGFHSITGDWRFRNHKSTLNQPDPDNKVWSQTSRQKEAARYKSRKIMANGDEILLGFVQLDLN